MNKKSRFQYRKIVYGLLLLGFLVFLVGASSLASVHAQGGGVLVKDPPLLKVLGNSLDVPANFAKLTPPNGSTLTTGNSVTMLWQPDGSGVFYYHCLDHTNNDKCDSNIYWYNNDNNRTITGLNTNSTYYWQVLACNSYGCRGANGGTWWSFNVPAMDVTSIGSQDGYVLEKSHGSGVGFYVNSTDPTFSLGDDVYNRQYRGFLSFDTSSIPDTAVITSAVLKIHSSGAVLGTNPFTILGPLYVDIRDGYFGNSANLQSSDFSAFTDWPKVSSFGTTPVSSWYSATLNSYGRAFINKIGLTQFRLYFNKVTNTNNVADAMKFVSGEGSSKPQLIITFTVP